MGVRRQHFSLSFPAILSYLAWPLYSPARSQVQGKYITVQIGLDIPLRQLPPRHVVWPTPFVTMCASIVTYAPHFFGLELSPIPPNKNDNVTQVEYQLAQYVVNKRESWETRRD